MKIIIFILFLESAFVSLIGCSSTTTHNIQDKVAESITENSHLDSLVRKLKVPSSLRRDINFSCRSLDGLYPGGKSDLVIVKFEECNGKYPELYTFVEVFNFNNVTKKLTRIVPEDDYSSSDLWMGTHRWINKALRSVRVESSLCIECDDDGARGELIFKYRKNRDRWEIHTED